MRIRKARKSVFPNLSVGTAVGDMIRRSADKHLVVRGEALHFVVLATEGKELTGKIVLENVSFQLRAEVVAVALLILGNIAGGSQLTDIVMDKASVRDPVNILITAAVKVEFLIG